MPKPGRPWRAAPMTGYMRRCSAIRIVFPPLLRRQLTTCGLRPTSRSALSPSWGSRANGQRHTNGVFHDDKRFWPIWERAAKLDVPIYIHPALPHPAVIEAYYKNYVQSHPGILRAAWGFTVETATQGLRFVLSGVFDSHPT